MQAKINTILSKIRNIIARAKLEKRDGAKVQVTTQWGTTYEVRELWPQGLAGRSSEGEGALLFLGGDTRSPILLPISGSVGQPDLQDDEIALFTPGKQRIVLRKDGSIELSATDGNADKSAIILAADGTISLNGTDFGGLVKWPELQTQLNKLNVLWTALTGLIGGPQIPEPGNGSPSALQAALSATFSTIINQQGQLDLPNYSEVESDTVSHGDGA